MICSKCGTNVIDKDRCPVCGNVLHERVVLFSEGSPNEFDEIESLAHRDQIVKMTALTFVLAAVGVLVSLLFFFEEYNIFAVSAGTVLTLGSMVLAFVTGSISRRMRIKLRRTYIATAVSCAAVAWCIFTVIITVLGN